MCDTFFKQNIGIDFVAAEKKRKHVTRTPTVYFNSVNCVTVS